MGRWLSGWFLLSAGTTNSAGTKRRRQRNLRCWQGLLYGMASWGALPRFEQKRLPYCSGPKFKPGSYRRNPGHSSSLHLPKSNGADSVCAVAFCGVADELFECIRCADGELEGVVVEAWRRVAQVVIDHAGIESEVLVDREDERGGEIRRERMPGIGVRGAA